MLSITKKQSEVLNFIVGFAEDNGYSPSYQEIANGLGLQSVATIHQHIKALASKGYLKSDFNKRRSLEAVSNNDFLTTAFKLPLIGVIAAGQPIEAIENPDSYAVPSSLVDDPANTYVLKVKGDSMIDEGIWDGDLVIVERNHSPKNGDVVVALLDNSYATLKKFYREAKRIRLQPANKALKPIFSRDPLIQGVVRAVIRSYAT
jgi:repressor LexA